MANLKQIATQGLLIFFCAGAFVLFAASCGGNEWYKYETGTFKTHSGLWEQCDEKGCTSIKATRNTLLKQMRAFSLLAVLASIAATLMAIAILFTDKIKTFFPSIFLSVAALCMVITLATFTDKNIRLIKKYTNVNWGWSYSLGWVGCVLAVTGSIFEYISSRQQSS